MAEFQAFLRDGSPLSNAPGVAEYNNLAYALLGQIITRVSGQPLPAPHHEKPPPARHERDRLGIFRGARRQLALGYRNREGTAGAWDPEPLLHDGTFGAMGGLLTTIDDFARYVAAAPCRLAARATIRKTGHRAAPRCARCTCPAIHSGLAAQA